MRRTVLAAIKTAPPVHIGRRVLVCIVPRVVFAKEIQQRLNHVQPEQQIQELAETAALFVRLAAALGTIVLQAQYPVNLVQLAMTVVVHQQYCVYQGNIPYMVLASVNHAQQGNFALIHQICPSYALLAIGQMATTRV